MIKTKNIFKLKHFLLSNRLYYNNAKQNINKMENIIDFRSDTLTKPTDAMRQVMLTAQVGDDVYGEDPTVRELEEKSAKLLGMEAAVYVPSGTMSNLIGAMVHCNRRGSEMIVGDKCHMFLNEQGNSAQFGGIHVNAIPNKADGTFDLDDMINRVRTRDLHEPYTSVVCVENTHNLCGGRVIPMNWLKELVKRCCELKIPLHMDGARLYNASVYLGIPVKEIVQGFATVSVCLSKGLGAPVGSILHGTKEHIYQARRIRKALGGGMRQCGILAAAGIYCLDNMVDRLADDHKNTKTLAIGISELKNPNFKVDVNATETNILIIEINPKVVDNKKVCEKLLELDVMCLPFGKQCIRMVVHHHITADAVEKALQKIKLVINEY